MKTKIPIIIALVLSVRVGLSQSFVNLDFESAKIISVIGGPNYPYTIATTNALPGWTVFIGGSQITQINYNDPAVGSTFVNLWATNGQQLSGSFSVLLQGGFNPPATISQTGLVPIGTESILFEAQQLNGQPGIANLVVSLGGQDLSTSALATGLNYTLYGAAIPVAFAGQSEQLEFSALGGLNNYTIDNIQFSASSVPEPGAFGLFALGGALLGLRHRKKISR
jgi:hypothetical protein